METNRNQAAVQEKSQLRAHMRALRKAISTEERQRFNHALAGQAKAYLKDPSVYCYVSLPDEAGTDEILTLLWDRNIKTAVPKVTGTRMDFYWVRGFSDLEPGAMHIREPKAGLPLADDRQALVLVPGLAFDREGYRLGYGGGYYDRFFREEPEHVRIGLAYDRQRVERVPREDWDLPLNGLLTNTGLTWY